MSEKTKCSKCNFLDACLCTTCSIISQGRRCMTIFECPNCELTITMPYCKRCFNETEDERKMIKCPICDSDIGENEKEETK